MSGIRIAFAGDRAIAVDALRFILSQDTRPLALLVTEKHRASHAQQLVALCPFLEHDHILEGRQFREPEGQALLQALSLDYILCVHFPYIVPERVLSIPRLGVLNLHPAYLPYNRGWHTPSWAVLEDTPAGATLHFVDTGIDTGDIIHQKRLVASPGDTAHNLYQRLLRLELEVLQEAWPQLVTKSFSRRPQNPNEGTFHKRHELLAGAIQQLRLDETVMVGDLIRKLRALTTNRVEEAAYYEMDGKRYRVQVVIHEEST